MFIDFDKMQSLAHSIIECVVMRADTLLHLRHTRDILYCPIATAVVRLKEYPWCALKQQLTSASTK